MDYGSKYYKDITVAKLKCNWNSNIVRAAMGVDFGGFLQNPEKEYEVCHLPCASQILESKNSRRSGDRKRSLRDCRLAR